MSQLKEIAPGLIPGLQLRGSLAIDSAGNVCIATQVSGGIPLVSPAGAAGSAT